ncbi:RNA-binding domain-containing protein [Morchella conica CCBAS932]|uniref:RNA-binding domain-containing protein n=1 Tax=Morchella conica CCBAS932 TaxID=1392247 RepID=A0A3N4KQI6_9PEZI|nr:RNA-binding domain-containing protein [Morchella conica CCBAS932]
MTTTAAPPKPLASYPANQTLYITNLNDRIRKDDLRLSLYTLFSTYGCVLDVNALKTMKGRGQAHIAFRDVASAAQALRACNGMNIFGKEMRIAYAKSKSHAISKLDGTFKLPTTAGSAAAEAVAPVPFVAVPSAPVEATTTATAGVKRQRDEESDEEEAMDVEDDDE